jgi:FkbM family methyltransferase
MNLVRGILGQLPASWVAGLGRLQWRHPLLKRIIQRCADSFRDRDGIIQRGIGRGLRFNPGQTNAGYLLGTSEPDLQEAFSQFVPHAGVVYDIGANVGFFAILAGRLVGPSGQVVCFEPLPSNVKSLRHNIEINEFETFSVQQVALDDCDGVATLATSINQALGRFETLGRPDAAGDTIEVSVKRLDTVVEELKLRPPSLIKIDVEGAEVRVLKGSTNVIEAAAPVLLIELHGTNEGVADFLEKHNYEIHVLGTPLGIRQADWHSHIVAIPSDRKTLNLRDISFNG